MHQANLAQLRENIGAAASAPSGTAKRPATVARIDPEPSVVHDQPPRPAPRGDRFTIKQKNTIARLAAPLLDGHAEPAAFLTKDLLQQCINENIVPADTPYEAFRWVVRKWRLEGEDID